MDSILRDKSKKFAKEIIVFCKEIKIDYKMSSLINQLLRSATSIGANIHEAQYAQSKNDFISKLEIAQKECHETQYWLELLYETDYIEQPYYEKFTDECISIQKMLTASVKTVKAKITKKAVVSG